MDVLGVDVDVGLVRILLHGGVVEVHYLLLEFYRTGAITLLFLCSSDCFLLYYSGENRLHSLSVT